MLLQSAWLVHFVSVATNWYSLSVFENGATLSFLCPDFCLTFPCLCCISSSLDANESEGGLFWMGIGLFLLSLALTHILSFPILFFLRLACSSSSTPSGFSFFLFFFFTPSALLLYYFYPFPYYLLRLSVLSAGAFILHSRHSCGQGADWLCCKGALICALVVCLPLVVPFAFLYSRNRDDLSTFDDLSHHPWST